MGSSKTQFSESPACMTSFDGSTSIHTFVKMPDRLRFWDDLSTEKNRIPRGAGLSYAAASFGASSTSIDHRSFNRIQSFNPNEKSIEVEAGITLGALYSFLAPRGWILSVQPGYPSITVGGCIGADVHGKNQFLDGTFMSLVMSLRLFHPHHGILELSRNKNPALFALTCGGFGLTGNILSAKLAIKPIPSPFVKMKVTPLKNAELLPEALLRAANRSELIFSWHNFTRKGENFGSGFIKEGCYATPEESDAYGLHAKTRLKSLKKPINSNNRRGWRFGYFNSLTVPLFNRLYETASRHGKKEQVIELYDFAFPVHDKISYFKLFGRAGFHEYQVIIPFDRYPAFIQALKNRLESQPMPITLASAKLFKGRRELLRFAGDGICLALNYPRNANSGTFAEFLDVLTIDAGGLPNLIKDSRLSAGTVKKTYGGYEDFKARLRDFDPHRLYRSHLSDRLNL